MYTNKYYKKKIKKTRKQKGRGFLFKNREISSPTPRELLVPVLMDKFQNNKKLSKLLESNTDKMTRLHVAIPGAFISQILTCIHQLDTIDRDDIYKIGVLYDVEPGKKDMNIEERHREFYTSMVLRLWVILNTLKNKFYEYPYNFLHNQIYHRDDKEIILKSLVDRTITMIDEKDNNYFIEPIYLDIKIIENIILWKKEELSTDELIDFISKYFNTNFNLLLKYVSQWIFRTTPVNIIEFNGEYYIDSYLNFINSDLTVLRKTLVIDIKIYKKLLAKLLQYKIDIRSKTDKDEKILLEKNITKLENLTNNMKNVFDKYFSQYGGKKSRKRKKSRKKKNTNKNSKKKMFKKN